MNNTQSTCKHTQGLKYIKYFINTFLDHSNLPHQPVIALSLYFCQLNEKEVNTSSAILYYKQNPL